MGGSLSVPTPLIRHGAREVRRSRGQQILCCSNTTNRTRTARSVGGYHQGLCSCAAGVGNGGVGVGNPPPLISISHGLDCNALAPSPSLCVRSCRRWQTFPHPGGGGKREEQDGRTRHPQSVPDEGPNVLSPGLWGEGALQCLPYPPGPGEESVPVEPLTRPCVHWVGGSPVVDFPGDGGGGN